MCEYSIYTNPKGSHKQNPVLQSRFSVEEAYPMAAKGQNRLRTAGVNFLDGVAQRSRLVALCHAASADIYTLVLVGDEYSVALGEKLCSVQSSLGHVDSDILQISWYDKPGAVFLAFRTLQRIQVFRYDEQEKKILPNNIFFQECNKNWRFCWNPVYPILSIVHDNVVELHKMGTPEGKRIIDIGEKSLIASTTWNSSGDTLALLTANLIATLTWDKTHELEYLEKEPLFLRAIIEGDTPRLILPFQQDGFLLFNEAKFADIKSIQSVKSPELPAFDTEVRVQEGDIIDITKHIPNPKSDRTIQNMFDIQQMAPSLPRAKVIWMKKKSRSLVVHQEIELDNSMTDPDVCSISPDGTAFVVGSSSCSKIFVFLVVESRAEVTLSHESEGKKTKGLQFFNNICLHLTGEPAPKRGLFSTSLSALYTLEISCLRWKKQVIIDEKQNRLQNLRQVFGELPVPTQSLDSKSAAISPTFPHSSTNEVKDLIRIILQMEERLNSRLDRMESAIQQQSRIIRNIQQSISLQPPQHLPKDDSN